MDGEAVEEHLEEGGKEVITELLKRDNKSISSQIYTWIVRFVMIALSINPYYYADINFVGTAL